MSGWRARVEKLERDRPPEGDMPFAWMATVSISGDNDPVNNPPRASREQLEAWVAAGEADKQIVSTSDGPKAVYYYHGPGPRRLTTEEWIARFAPGGPEAEPDPPRVVEMSGYNRTPTHRPR